MAEKILPESDWDLSREYADDYADWRYEVANGDTVAGFRAWFIARNPEG